MCGEFHCCGGVASSRGLPDQAAQHATPIALFALIPCLLLAGKPTNDIANVVDCAPYRKADKSVMFIYSSIALGSEYKYWKTHLSHSSLSLLVFYRSVKFHGAFCTTHLSPQNEDFITLHHKDYRYCTFPLFTLGLFY